MMLSGPPGRRWTIATSSATAPLPADLSRMPRRSRADPFDEVPVVLEGFHAAFPSRRGHATHGGRARATFGYRRFDLVRRAATNGNAGLRRTHATRARSTAH